MHVAIVNLTAGGLSGGYRKYLQAVVPHLRRDRRVSRVDVYLPEMERPPAIEADAVRHFPSRDDARRWIAESRPDVVFVPTAQALDCGRPVVSMVRNMEPLSVPFEGNPWSERARNVLRASAARRAAVRADRIIAVSRHVRDFLVGRWGIDPAKVGVVYHGVEAGDEERRPAGLDGVERFLFTAGSIRPARGLDDLTEIGGTLVIAGDVDPRMERYARGLRERLRGRDVRWLGRLDAAEMAWCFRRCRAFVMTSRAEACPNTVLEAMAEGCISISTDCAPMPEFFGDAAVYYAARDARNLAARVAALDATDTGALRERAFARARDFTWEATASQTVDQLERALR
jgi:glycosyltransferase involved in cell wall biosynthesis